MVRSCFTSAALFACVFACASAPLRIHAQATAAEKAAAESLFDEGLSLLEAGRYQQACDKLQKSQAIESGIGTLLYLGECYAKLGRTASAWASFREAASAAQARGQTARARAGTARADELEPTLSRLTITTVPENRALEGFRVEYDGTLLANQLLGTAFPADPGKHTLTASAPGYQGWRGEVTVSAQGASASASVPALVPEPEPVAASESAPERPDDRAPAPPARASRTERGFAPSGQEVAGLVVGGVGVVALGVGTYFGLRAISENADAERGCPETDVPCDDPQAVGASQDANDAAVLSNVFVFGGLATIAGGALLYFLAGDDEQAPAVALAADVAPDGRSATVWLTGAF